MPFRWSWQRYMCFYCEETFNIPSELKGHTITHKDIKLKSFIKNLKAKYRIKWDVSEIKCKKCWKTFENLDIFLDHLNSIHNIEMSKDFFSEYCYSFMLADDRLPCTQCGEVIKSFSTLLKHMHTYHSTNCRDYICDVCSKSFTRRQIISHFANAHTILKNHCKLCPQTFPTRYALNKHCGITHDMKFNCPICHKVLGSKYLKKLHLATVHNEKKYQFTCPECFKVYPEMNKMIRHRNAAHLKELSTCDVCGYQITDSCSFKRHINAHYVVWYCDGCNKPYRTKKSLRAHQNKRRYTELKCSMDAFSIHIPDDDRLEEKRRKNDLTRLLTIIIENSTIMPFRSAANKFMCFYCCCTFVDCVKLKDHTKEEHSNARLHNVLRTLIGNSRVKLDTSEIICKKCMKPFKMFDEFLSHVSESHGFKFNREISNCLFTFNLSDDVMSCSDCGQEFRFFGPLLKHAHKFHNKYKTFLCEICGQGFVAKANVDSHIKNVHSANVNSGQCLKCDKVFKTPYALQIHAARSHKTETLKCPKCPEILASQYLKKRHLALVHDVKKLQFNCDQCDRVFTMKSRLVQHQLRTHMKLKTVACEICGFKVFNNDLLKRHMVKHNDSRPYQCEFCKKTFQRKRTLDVHTRIHTNDKRYVCKDCGRAFVQTTSWKLHMRVHHSGNDNWS